MLKNKIYFKLSLYFTISLLTFSIIIGSIFMVLFKNHTTNLYKVELGNHAASISSNLSQFMDSDASQKMRGYGAYLRFIEDIAGTDVWVIDNNLNIITGETGRGGAGINYNYADLPPNVDTLIKSAFKGETVFSESFSSIFKEPMLTVATPIKDSNGYILGVVLLHSSVYGVNQAIYQGFMVLAISTLIAFVISILLSVWLSIRFTKPLSKMKSAALQIVNGDYGTKTNIKQNDEIGELANIIDMLTDRLYDASCESIKLSQMRKDFVANISHELKTPVTVIRGSLEALIDKAVTTPMQIENYHNQMLKEVIFLQRLIEDLLELSKLQSVDFIIEKQTISICDLLDDVIRSGSQIANKKHIKINTDKDISDCAIYGDYGRLRQMILIVLNNAIRFSPKNGVIDVNLKNKVLSICDYGPGISEEDLPYIFERFYKSNLKQNNMGTGLGLAIAKQIAQKHNIEIYAESTAEKGAKFVFKF